MKKIGLIVILILLVTNHVAAQNKTVSQDEMTQLADLTTEANVKVDKWQVTFKENMTKESLLSLIDEWKNSYLDSYSEDENVIKYTFRNVHKNADIVEYYTVIMPKNSNYQSELIAVLSGENWNEKVEDRYLDLQDAIYEQYFTENVTKFACLTTESNDTMKGVYLVDLLKKELQLSHITTQIDNVERSMNKKNIYGYTPLWKKNFKILGNPVNVNIAITNTTNGETKLTIGTPILITEY